MINSIFFTAPLSSRAVEVTDGGGFECIFHANIGGKNGTVWVTCYYRGKKAEAIFPHLTKGTMVCVHGALGPRESERDGSIIINAREVAALEQGECSP